MQSKDKNIKTICTENKIEPLVLVPAKVVAEMVGGSTSMVKQVRQGKKGDKGKMCNKIIMADGLLAIGIQATIDQVSAIINQEDINQSQQ